MATSFAVFAALVAVVATLSFVGERPAKTYGATEAFADAARRAGLSLAPTRTLALGTMQQVEVRAELVQTREQGRVAMRCVATLSPELGLGLTARSADDRDVVRAEPPSALEVPAPPELTALALHPDLAEPLLAGRVGDVLCKMVEAGFEPRLRDGAAETWVAEPTDADRLLVAMTATAEVAWLAVEERKKLSVPERVRTLGAALTDAAEDLELPLEHAADAFEVRLEHGSIHVHLEREATRAITVLELALEHSLRPRERDSELGDLRAIPGVDSARITDAGDVVVEVGHASGDSSELRVLVAALDQLASARATDAGPIASAASRLARLSARFPPP